MLDFTPVAPARHTARLVTAGVVALLLIIGLVVVAGVVADPFGIRKRALDDAQADAAQAQGEATVAGGQADAAYDAAAIVAGGAERDRETFTIHTENTRVIERAPGADARLPDGFVGALNRGLCRYEATPDPGCAELRGDDPD